MAALFFNTVSSLRSLLLSFSPFKSKPFCKYGLPLPPTCHAVVPDEAIGDLPILIIGDIHGCYSELQDLIAKAKEVVKSADLFLIFVGDMINKGPKSLEVLTLVREWSNRGRAVAVKGNHEESILREYRSIMTDYGYQFPQKYAYLKQFSHEDFSYLQNLPYSLTVPKINSIVVHAGIVPGIPLNKQQPLNLCHMRNIIVEHRLWGNYLMGNSKLDKGVSWSTLWEGPQHIYYGHDAFRGFNPQPFSTGLDTGCVYGKSLTGVVITSDMKRHFVQVQAKELYKPVE